MRTVILILTLSMIFVLSGCGGDDSPTAPAGTNLKGKVTAKATGAAVSGAKISFGDMVTTSDAGGNYTIANVPKVKQALKAETSNYAVYIEDFTAVNGENVKDIELETFSEYCARVTSVVYQGKTYNTVLIGNQCWFKDNLNVGTKINSSVKASNDTKIEKYCFNDISSNCDTYGGLYLWKEAMKYIQASSNQGICPDGWHIPTDVEFQTLIDFVDGNSNALKDEGIGDPVNYPAGVGTNTSGFTGYFGGSYWQFITENQGEEWDGLGGFGAWWSSTQVADNEAQYLGFNEWADNMFWGGRNMDWGKSIRCLKD